MAMGITYQTLSQVISLGMQNTLSSNEAIQAQNVTLTAQGANLFLSVPSAATTVATQKVLTGNQSANDLLANLLSMITGSGSGFAASHSGNGNGDYPSGSEAPVPFEFEPSLDISHSGNGNGDYPFGSEAPIPFEFEPSLDIGHSDDRDDHHHDLGK
ncbi:RebB family R body protein [Chloroflexi bacterium TSY]|nr:RebB family R body protein [Chloroflexi bacterium TSY]